MKKFIAILFFIFLVNPSFTQNNIAGVYKCSDEDLIRFNSDGSGKFYISYITDEVVPFNWSASDNSISISPSDVEQRYSIMPIYMDYSITNGIPRLSHRTVGPTFIYSKQ